MFTTRIFPDKLKIAKVKPLFKKREISSFNNYRPISLLPSISKIFEKAIYDQYTHIVNKTICFIRVNMDSDKAIQQRMQHSNLLIEFYNI